VAVFIALEVIVDLFTLRARNLSVSSGSTVLVVIMALFGPAPALLAGSLSMVLDTIKRRVRLFHAITNLAVFSALPIIGGLGFVAARDWLGLEISDPAYGVVVAGGFIVIEALNFALIGLGNPVHAGVSGRRIFAATSLAMVPWHLASAVIAGGAVVAYEQIGLEAVVLLIAMLAVSTPLLRTVIVALQRADAMSELMAASDARAAEVARLASDRARLLDEVVAVAEQERGRLAETLHDGPLQRLLLIRQDLAERSEPWLEPTREDLDEAVRETRALVGAFHPIATTELGFEATVRAAALLRGTVSLELDLAAGDEQLADPMLCSIARELVMNAVKHARPTVIRVAVTVGDAGLALAVSDDGRGIEEEAPGVQAGHVGLALARRRVEDAGGALEIRTLPAGGTHVRVTMPFDRAD
jgi:two-component system NarL family sensor kinase